MVGVRRCAWAANLVLRLAHAGRGLAAALREAAGAVLLRAPLVHAGQDALVVVDRNIGPLRSCTQSLTLNSALMWPLQNMQAVTLVGASTRAL